MAIKYAIAAIVLIGACACFSSEDPTPVRKSRPVCTARVNPKVGIIDEAYRWTDNTVVYQFSSSIPSKDRQTILKGMQDIIDHTCIKFRPRRRSDKNYVTVTNKRDAGCYSDLGMVGGSQELNLGRGCMTPDTAAHEFIHALGFLHEQARFDRDDYIRINWDNMNSSRQWTSQYDKVDPEYYSNFDVPYDFKSLMHYSKMDNSINGKPVMEALEDPDIELGNYEGLTEFDALKIKLMYKCE